ASRRPAIAAWVSPFLGTSVHPLHTLNAGNAGSRLLSGRLLDVVQSARMDNMKNIGHLRRASAAVRSGEGQVGYAAAMRELRAALVLASLTRRATAGERSRRA